MSTIWKFEIYATVINITTTIGQNPTTVCFYVF